MTAERIIVDSTLASMISRPDCNPPAMSGLIPPLSALRRIRRGEKIRGGKVGL